MIMKRFELVSGVSGELVSRVINHETALDSVISAIDTHKGAIFSSGFDYPGRHSRWDIAFINPAIEFKAKGRSFEINALNGQGVALLQILNEPLSSNPHVAYLEIDPFFIRGVIHESPMFFTEEERSRVPSVFSIIRAILSVFDTRNAKIQCNDSIKLNHFGLYGAFGYDLIFQFESIKTSLIRNDDTPDCHLFLPLDLFVVDRKKEFAEHLTLSLNTELGETASLDGGGEEFEIPLGQGSDEICCDHKPGEFAEKVDKVVQGTKRGDYFEVVLSQSFSSRFDGPPTALFARLGELNPSPYMFLINLGKEQLVGTSPEIYVRVTNRKFETCPIAGTIPRGKTPIEDADRVKELISSDKDEAELTMCTDVDRNDMARVCKPGSVRIIGRRQLEFYSHLIHTVDHVEGVLKDEFDALDAFQTHMWACTVTGAPKPAAIQEIENLESSPRGYYSAAVGLLLFNGDINTGITLRTARLKEGRATIRAGATLLYWSDPIMEERESRTKAGAFLAALTAVKRSSTTRMVDGNADTSHIKLGMNEPLLSKKVLLVDCKDSFVHNLGAYIREVGAEVTTLRVGFDLSHINRIKPDLVILSPGPGLPKDFGLSELLQRLVSLSLPVFGVCLGHQAIGEFFGASLEQLAVPVHGKPSKVVHNNVSIFTGIDREFTAGRYHSIHVVQSSMPKCLNIIAKTETSEIEDSVVMSIQHKELPIAGVQFHPESLMTLRGQSGHILLRNVLRCLT